MLEARSAGSWVGLRPFGHRLLSLTGPRFNFWLLCALLDVASLCSLACNSPICVLHVPKWWFGSGFIRLSTMFTSVSTFGTSSFLSMTSSQMWWYLTSMCLGFAWYTRFQMRWIALYESHYRVRARWSIRLLAEKLAVSRCNQIASLVASNAAMYSAFVVESIMHSPSIDEDIPWCRFLIVKVVDIIRICEAFDFGKFSVPLRYRNMCFTTSQCLFSRIRHVLAGGSYDIGQVWLGGHHHVHKASYDRCIGYSAHEQVLLLCGWRASVR